MMPSQDDDSEEESVNSLHDVMALMTRRFGELLVKQDERQAKQFAELIDYRSRRSDILLKVMMASLI